MSPFRAVKAYARLTREYFIFNLKSALEYRTNFIIMVAGMFLNNLAFCCFWRVLFDRAGNIAGYGFKDVMFLWAISSASFGLAHVVFGNCRALGQLIVSGGLDVYLLQPKNELYHFAVSKTSVSAWGDLVYGWALMVLITGFDPLRWLAFLAFTVSGALLFAASFLLVDCLAFFLRSAAGFSRLYLELMLNASLYPDAIFGANIRWLFYSLIPAGYIVFLPAKAFWKANLVAGSIAFGAAALYAALAFFVFKRGLKRYESGNLVGTRI